MSKNEVYELPYFEYLTLVETMNIETQYQEREINKTQSSPVSQYNKKVPKYKK